MISGVERFNTGLDTSFNNYIIKQLYMHSSWALSYDEDLITKGVLRASKDMHTYSDSGMLLKSFDIYQSDYLNQHNLVLNNLADLIFNIIIEKQKKYLFKGPQVTRILWNYYNRSSTGVEHVDSCEPNTGSIIYYLNTCDSFTFINEEYIDCVMGTGAIFSANSVHRGTGPTKSKNKFALNILFKYK